MVDLGGEALVQPAEQRWSLLSPHGLVLVYIATRPNATMREIAMTLHLTERTIYRIVRDLLDAGVVGERAAGRGKAYAVNPDARFSQPFAAGLPVRAFLDALTEPES